MEAIFASKLYKHSMRKDKIASALSNPINMELVQQIEDYLDEDATNDVDTHKDGVAEVGKSDIKVDDSDTEITPSESHLDHSSRKSSSIVDKDSVDVDTDNTKSSENTDVENTTMSDVDEKLGISERDETSVFHTPKKPDSDEKDSVEESTSINSATVLYQPAVESSCCNQIRVDAAEIKGTLNIREDTKGVSRIFVKDNELWIYYQDKVNLNSVMEPVIEVLNSVGFTNLEFNRLARTDNAIVFEISCVYDQVKPIVEINKEV